MKILSNLLYASIILSILLLIVISFLLNEYEIEMNDYIKLLFYVFSINAIFMYYQRKSILEVNNFKPITAAAEVFNEVTDSQQLNGFMSVRNILGNGEELIIDNIPKSITCNNIVV